MMRQLLLGCALLSLFCGWSQPVSAEEKGARFEPLFNGKDLSGWEAKDGNLENWKAEGDLLSCLEGGSGWLRTSKIYADYVLKLEYRLSRGGNSGVGLRFPQEGNPAHVGMEVQILDDSAPEYKDLLPHQRNGGIYFQAAPRKSAAKPLGEWNEYEITCRGPFIKVMLNGELVNEIDVRKYTKAEGEYSPLSDRPEVGYIGLQAHGQRVDFRNIQLKNLNSYSANGVAYLDLVEGAGDPVPEGARITVHYTGRLTDGKTFDSSRAREMPATFPLGAVIKGWAEGIPGMRVGGRRKLVIPPNLAYGEKGIGKVIPPHATLVFDVEVLKIE